MRRINNEHNFGLVSGSIQSHVQPEPGTQLTLVLHAVALLLDWRKRAPFHCDATVRFVDESLQYRVVARPRHLSYEVTNVQTGVAESLDSSIRMIPDGVTDKLQQQNQINTEPMAVRLAFPLSLGIWGRPSDSYRISGAHQRGNEFALTLTHQQQPGLVGELVIDQGRQTAIRLSTPTLTIEYRNIQPER
jgi:hypothetical protein